MKVARQLVEQDSVTRAYLGVALDANFDPSTTISVGLSRPHGARIKVVTPGSPADLAALQVDDIILEYGDVAVDSDSHLISLVGLTEIGHEVPLVVLRKQKVIRLTVRDGATPSDRAATK
jgi:serine protease Do